MPATGPQASLGQGGGEDVGCDRDLAVGGQTGAYLMRAPSQGAPAFNLSLRTHELGDADADSVRGETRRATLLHTPARKVSDPPQRMTCSCASFGARRANAVQ